MLNWIKTTTGYRADDMLGTVFTITRTPGRRFKLAANGIDTGTVADSLAAKKTEAEAFSADTVASVNAVRSLNQPVPVVGEIAEVREVSETPTAYPCCDDVLCTNCEGSGVVYAGDKREYDFDANGRPVPTDHALTAGLRAAFGPEPPTTPPDDGRPNDYPTVPGDPPEGPPPAADPTDDDIYSPDKVLPPTFHPGTPPTDPEATPEPPVETAPPTPADRVSLPEWMFTPPRLPRDRNDRVVHSWLPAGMHAA